MKPKLIYLSAFILTIGAIPFVIFNAQKASATLSVVGLGSKLSPQLIQLTLLISGEELGYLEPCGCAEGQLGGLPRRDSLIQSLAMKRENLLLVANGDLIAEANPQSGLKAEIGFTALKEMRYTAFNVGEKDLLIGVNRLKYLEKTSGIPFLSANLFLGNRPIA